MNKLPVVEFVIFYRQYSGIIQEKVVDGNEDGTVLEDLLCGTQYEVQIHARNQVGTGARSGILRAMTRGSGPIQPQVDALTSFVSSSPSTLILHLDHWFSGGCPINYIRVEKKGPADPAWSVLSNNINPDEQPMFKLHDFIPDEVYHLKLTASSDAGSQTALYSVQRLSRESAETRQLQLKSAITNWIFQSLLFQKRVARSLISTPSHRRQLPITSATNRWSSSHPCQYRHWCFYSLSQPSSMSSTRGIPNAPTINPSYRPSWTVFQSIFHTIPLYSEGNNSSKWPVRVNIHCGLLASNWMTSWTADRCGRLKVAPTHCANKFKPRQ